ncbi:MAG: DUF1353 domain-containing protein [Betaproteobacteria bacterium]|nr:DUF1353 domain-containing protein [Betaproteobacteria bacterium]
MKYLRSILVIVMVFCAFSARAESGFEGIPELIPIDDSFIEQYKTINELIYRQKDGRVWVIPEGSVVDGRGFPRLFVDIFGSGLNADFVKSAIAYDFAAKSKHHSWKLAQIMLHEAMQAEGVPLSDANLAFMLLRATGTRWSIKGYGGCARCHGPTTPLEWRPLVKDEDILDLVDWARNERLSLSEIESKVLELIIEEGPHSTVSIR